MFNSNNLSKYLTQFKKYSNVIVILDDDAAGIKGLIETRALFMYQIPFVTYVKLKPDANEILTTHGKEGLRKEMQRHYTG